MSNRRTKRRYAHELKGPWEHPGHHETQHRDGNPPWCGKCGWAAPVRALLARQFKEADRIESEAGR